MSAFGQLKVNFFEGEVSLDGAKLVRNEGLTLRSGALLQTGSGRLELRLAEDVYFRLGEQSTARVAGDRAIELLSGAAVVDSTRSTADATAAVRLANATVRMTVAGDYRFDAIPAQLRVYRGRATVTIGERVLNAEKGAAVALADVVAGQTPPEHDSLLDIWSTNRRIHLTTSFASVSQTPEQPTVASDKDLAAGPASSTGLLFLSTVPEPTYRPLRPYREGSGFFGPPYVPRGAHQVIGR